MINAIKRYFEATTNVDSVALDALRKVADDPALPLSVRRAAQSQLRTANTTEINRETRRRALKVATITDQLRDEVRAVTAKLPHKYDAEPETLAKDTADEIASAIATFHTKIGELFSSNSTDAAE